MVQCAKEKEVLLDGMPRSISVNIPQTLCILGNQSLRQGLAVNLRVQESEHGIDPVLLVGSLPSEIERQELSEIKRRGILVFVVNIAVALARNRLSGFDSRDGARREIVPKYYFRVDPVPALDSAETEAHELM